MTDIKNLKRGEKINISTIAQIADMTPDQFACFHTDLKDWFAYIKALKEMNADTEAATGEKDVVQCDTDFLAWIYDDKGNANISVQAINEDNKALEQFPELEINIKRLGK